MKLTVLLLASAVAAQAAVVEFDLSPLDTDVDVGLSPSNAVPAVTNSTGSGDKLPGNNLYLDMDSEMLMIGIGYGSAAGFSNLTGVATAAHIEGPANPGETNGIVVDLAPIHFVQVTNPSSGGIIHGAIDLSLVSSNAMQELLDGLWYVNIYTATNAAGEIRGQLIPANVAPTVICSADSTNECGELSTVEVMVKDADGDDLTLEWSLNGVPMETVNIPGDAALAGTNIVIAAEYPLGTNVLEFVAMDTVGMTSSCSTTVVVEDTIPPVIARASADPSSLWPPNHKMVAVNVSARVEDACGGVRWRIAKVTSNEPLNDTGDGNTEQDWNIVDRDTVELRAERSGNLEGRVYTIWLEARDGAGNEAEPKSVKVTVPHDQGKKKSKRSRWW